MKMKTIYSIIAGVIFVGISSTASAYVYSQNFDGMGPAGTTAPAGWTELYIAGSSTSLVAPTGAEMATAVVGNGSSLAVWNQSSASTTLFLQAANMGSTASDANRLLGTSPSGVRGEVIELSVVNNNGRPSAQSPFVRHEVYGARNPQKRIRLGVGR